MQHTAFYSPLGASDLEPDPIFNVVIAYEDFETGKHAKETYDFLVNNLRHECRFENQMWKFDVLSIPKLREMAAKDALAADIIIISCRGAHELSPDVKAWIDSWCYGRSNAIALVGLFGKDTETSDNKIIRNYLADVARRARIQFFAQPNALPFQQFNSSFASDRGAHGDEKTLSALAGFVQRDQTFPHWGINE